jgi:hypothetical protein
LPVKVSTLGATLKAILRLGVHTGISVRSPGVPLPPGIKVMGSTDLSASIGIESTVFANLAEFVTEISVPDEEDCKMKVVEAYVSTCPMTTNFTA